MKKKKKRITKKVPPATQQEINSALAEFIAKGGSISNIGSSDIADPFKQYIPGFNQFSMREEL